VIGGQGEPEQPSIDEVRTMRVQQARTRTRWREIPETQLVRRDRRWFVDAEDDHVYTLHRGDVFGPEGIIRFAEDRADLVYFVRPDGELVLLEPSSIARTWSEIVERQTRAKAAR
jgi:hypothetical protein